MSTPASFVGRHAELRLLGEGLAAARMSHPQVVYLEGEAGSGKSALVSRFLSSLSGAVVLAAGGDEAETLLTYGILDQLQPGTRTEPGADPMAAGARLLDLLDTGLGFVFLHHALAGWPAWPGWAGSSCSPSSTSLITPASFIAQLDWKAACIFHNPRCACSGRSGWH